ncbi:hypothetical protein [Ferrigenium kumadai]|nr:hypothetical protein [Ferrigenium kumadai]
MRLILILTAIMAQLFLTDISWADTYEDCKESCETDKEARDIDCPSPYDSSTGGQERGQCMKDSQEAYNRCLSSCPRPTPPSPPSSESPISPMNY